MVDFIILCHFAKDKTLILFFQCAKEITQQSIVNTSSPSTTTSSSNNSSWREVEVVKEKELSHPLEREGDIENGQMLPLITRSDMAITIIES